MAVTETDKLNKSENTDIGNAKAIIFDRQWNFSANVNANTNAGINLSNNVQGYVELRVLESPQSQQCVFCWATAIAGFQPLQYNVDVNGDSYREFGLPGYCRLMVDVANFRASRRQVMFDLLVELKLPGALSAPVTIYNDTVHCAVPTSNILEEQLRGQIPNITQVERALAQVRALASTTN